jgi:hypothetical protein
MTLKVCRSWKPWSDLIRCCRSTSTIKVLSAFETWQGFGDIQRSDTESCSERRYFMSCCRNSPITNATTSPQIPEKTKLLKSALTFDICRGAGFRFCALWWYDGLFNTTGFRFCTLWLHDSLLDTADWRIWALWYHNRGFHNTGYRFFILSFLNGWRNTTGCRCCALRFPNSSLNTAGSRILVLRRFCSHRRWRRTRSYDWARRSRRSSHRCYENEWYLATGKETYHTNVIRLIEDFKQVEKRALL